MIYLDSYWQLAYIFLPEEATEEQLDETEEVVLVILEAALLSESLPEIEF